MNIKIISPLPQTYLPISACLLGINTKYSGSNNSCASLFHLMEVGYFVPILFCPEQLGGLCTPRDKSEICGKNVFMKNGNDVTTQFYNGAQEALKILRLYPDVKSVLLKSLSPSCGVGTVYDGTFSGQKVSGNGITAKLLLENNYNCVSSDNFCRDFKPGYYLGLAEEYSIEPFDDFAVKNKGCFYCE